jgi:DNA-binding CsgD family transcriptional regulator
MEHLWNVNEEAPPRRSDSPAPNPIGKEARGSMSESIGLSAGAVVRTERGRRGRRRGSDRSRPRRGSLDSSSNWANAETRRFWTGPITYTVRTSSASSTNPRPPEFANPTPPKPAIAAKPAQVPIVNDPAQNLLASTSPRRARTTQEARRLPGRGSAPTRLQVALLVAGGSTNKEASAALFLSAKTVAAHLGRIYRKLGLRSRTELAARFAGASLAQAARPRAAGA